MIIIAGRRNRSIDLKPARRVEEGSDRARPQAGREKKEKKKKKRQEITRPAGGPA